MREKDGFSRITDKCKEETVYVLNQKGTKRTLPFCIYYDQKNNKCELNGCLKNFNKEKK